MAGLKGLKKKRRVQLIVLAVVLLAGLGGRWRNGSRSTWKTARN